MNLNKVFVLGNLTRDPEMKSLPSGTSVATFGMATNRFFTKDGQKQQDTEFHNIVAFGKLAETVSSFLKKGGLVLIEGRIKTRNWQDQSGNKKNRTEIVAERIQLGPRGISSAGKNYGKPTAASAPSDEEIPIIEEEEEQIDVKDIPF